MSYTLDEWLSPNCNAGSYAKVGFTIHHAATTSFTAIGQTFQNTSRQTSAHYGVEPGHVQRYVYDGYIAWHAGNSYANAYTIGIECVNSGGSAAGWPVADATVDTLVEFMADKCRDLAIASLTRNVNLWGHKDWSATACPGVLYDRLDEIASRVNALLSGTIEDNQKEDEMHALVNVNDIGVLAWVANDRIHDLDSPDTAQAVADMYSLTHNGAEIPCFVYGSEASPWMSRFVQACRNGVPNDERLDHFTGRAENRCDGNKGTE